MSVAVLASALGAGLVASPAGAVVPVLTASPNQLDLGNTAVGQISSGFVTLHNASYVTDRVDSVVLSGADPADFHLYGFCTTTTTTTIVSLATTGFTVFPGETCTLLVVFIPGSAGPRSATATVDDQSATHPTVNLSGNGTLGYYEASATGAVYAFGNATNVGDVSGFTLSAPVVSMATTPITSGYWLATADGGIFSYGTARFYGSTGGIVLNKPVVGMAATPDGRGYWLVASDGGIFAFGDAAFHGSTGSLHLNQPIVGMATTPDGNGYWLVAADGGIFAYGDAQFYGSTGGMTLNQPIVGMASTPDGKGYWLVAADGGIFAYGDAQFYGSTGSLHLNQPIVGMAATPTGGGYWFTAADGGIFAFGNAPYLGSTGGTAVSHVVGMASTGSALPLLLSHLFTSRADLRADLRIG